MAPLLQNLPLWLLAAETPRFSPLQKDVDAETCVVGAGIAGLSMACLLAQEGRRVVVVTQRMVGEGETMRTTAHLTNVLDRRYFELEYCHGSLGAQLVAASHRRALDRIEESVGERHEAS